MRRFSRFRQRCGKRLLISVLCAVCALAGFVAGASTSAQKQMVVTPYPAARFAPLDPARPDGAQVAVLWGEPDRGESAMYLRIKKGEGRMHTHTADYHLVVIAGAMKHWAAGEAEADAKPLGPGSYWFQPGNQPHTDSCLSEECLMFIKWEGRRDARLAETPKKE